MDVDGGADAESLSGIAKGQPRALGEFYDRHAGVVYALAIRILNDAAEVVQDVFVQIWRHANTYDGTRPACHALPTRGPARTSR